MAQFPDIYLFLCHPIYRSSGIEAVDHVLTTYLAPPTPSERTENQIGIWHRQTVDYFGDRRYELEFRMGEVREVKVYLRAIL